MAKSSPKWVENTVGKGQIARHEQFHLFPQCFEKTCTADTLKPGLVWESVNPLPNNPYFYQQLAAQVKALIEKEKMLTTNVYFPFRPKSHHWNRIFSSAVFGENPRYCYSLGIVLVVILQTL